MTLVEFLRARISEDAAEAMMATDYHAEGGMRLATTYETEGILTLGAGVRLEARTGRALAEVAAKRRLVDLHAMREDGRGCYNCDTVDEPCLIHSALGLSYASHADYREEWRP